MKRGLPIGPVNLSEVKGFKNDIIDKMYFLNSF